MFVSSYPKTFELPDDEGERRTPLYAVGFSALSSTHQSLSGKHLNPNLLSFLSGSTLKYKGAWFYSLKYLFKKLIICQRSFLKSEPFSFCKRNTSKDKSHKYFPVEQPYSLKDKFCSSSLAK